MGIPFTPPPAAVTRILSRFNRADLSSFIIVAIDLLDVADGDADLEDATGVEDAFESHVYDGPGCPVADPGGGNVEDEGEGIDEREPDNGGHCSHYGVDQTEPLNGWPGSRVLIDAIT